MTKEKLEKEATEYAQKLGVKDFIAKPKEIIAYFSYLAGAEPREKRIAELEEKLANADYQLEGRDNEIAELQDKLKNLESVAEVRLANWQKYEQENAELKKENENLASIAEHQQSSNMKRYFEIKDLEKENSELKELLKWALHSDPEHDEDFEKKWEEAEQFISEVEK